MSICVNIEGKTVSNVKKGSTIEDLIPLYATNHNSPVIAAKYNNEIVQLTKKVASGAKISFIDIDSGPGVRIYKRSLQFLLMLAMKNLMPECRLKVSHPVNNGVYCHVSGNHKLSEKEIKNLEKEMHRLVKLKLPVTKVELPREKAKEFLKRNNRQDRLMVIDYINDDKITFYKCGEYYDYFFSSIVSNTRFLKVFSLKYHEDGLVIVHPVRYHSSNVAKYKPSVKLYKVFSEFKSWGRILGIDSVGQLNEMAKNGEIKDMILVCEALQSKKIANIADEITLRKKPLVLISGPSSSGKTTFSKRLAIALRVNGIKAVTISLDNYYMDQNKTPKDDQGELDLEHINALDLKLLNNQLIEIFKFKQVELPKFNFNTGKRDPKGQLFHADEDTVIIMEGIHALNNELTKKISSNLKYKIYVSALATINIDDHVRISTTDNRLIRRMVRDVQYRYTEAEDTLKMWGSVRAGEKRWVFPYQEEADVMFNSALYYELSVLKSYAEPLLKKLDNDFSQYSTARRLLHLLRYFYPVKEKRIPNNSILREFIGGSCFRT